MHRSLLSNTFNTRDLGGYPIDCKKATTYKMFLRSDVPLQISDDDRKLLLSNNITTIVDLRNDNEAQSKPCALRCDANFQYYHCKIYGDGCLPVNAEAVPDSYFEMIDEQKSVLNIMKVFINADSGVLYHCTAGKDRTGVISALLLLLAGVCKTDILTDYEISQVYLSSMIQQLCKNNKDLNVHIITPKLEYMEKFLKMFKQKYHSTEKYFSQIGLSDNEILHLKSKLISNTA